MSYKAGFCGLIGLPNAGKSSLMNWLVKDKVSIVTAKPQTTRRRILGLWSEDDKAQIVFVDAPGVVKATKGLNAFLEAEAKDVIDSSDVLLFVLSIDEKEKDAIDSVIELAKGVKKPKAFVINKMDIRSVEHRRRVLRSMIEVDFPEAQIFEVTSKQGEETEHTAEDIRNFVISLLPEAKAPLYDPDLMTPHSLREMAAEFVREQCFVSLHQEVPYGLAVRIAKFEEEPSIYRIYAEIMVARDGHKAIVIGQKGSVIKEIGTQARRAMEKSFGQKVFLDMHVLVNEDWDKNPRVMKEFGYVIPT